jgi:hypothetical protein
MMALFRWARCEADPPRHIRHVRKTAFVGETSTKGTERDTGGRLDQRNRGELSGGKERLHVAVTWSSTDENRVIHGETQSEIPLALSIMTIKFLHMGPGFRRNPDISQVIRRKKCKKKSIKG